MVQTHNSMSSSLASSWVIDGNTRVMGLIGQQVRHSLSPLIHNFSIQQLGLNAAYLVFDVAPGSIRNLLALMWELDAIGFSVTTPHKESVANITLGHKLGSVNTLVRGAHGWMGASTDAEGLSLAIKRMGFDFHAFSRIVIMGNGGAAKAVLHHIGKSFDSAPELVVLRRDQRRDAELMAIMPATIPLRFVDLTPNNLTQELSGYSGETVLIQATSAPLHGDDLRGFAPSLDSYFGVVVDMVYRARSEILAAAMRRKLPAQDGLPMLIEQARLAQKLWWGQNVSFDSIHSYLMQHGFA